jgi:hypothetical protein
MLEIWCKSETALCAHKLQRSSCQSGERAKQLEYGFAVSYRLIGLSTLKVAVLALDVPLVWVETWVLVFALESPLA